MAKPEQGILAIEPQNELKFEGPFVMPVVSFIKLTNISEKKVHFKLKTTAPKKYCVRPNSGVLSDKGAVEVQVVLQPFIFNPAEKHKHKFMVQFMAEPEGWTNSPEDLWKCIAPDKIMNYKLKCVFEMPSGASNDQMEPAPAENTAAIVADEKSRKISDNYKTASKSNLVGNGGELQKVAAEVKQLREEEIKLRQENLTLKDELLRLQQKGLGKDIKHDSYSPPATHHGLPELSDRVPSQYIVIGLLIAIFSFILAWSSFTLLYSCTAQWVSTSGSLIPEGAISAGESAQGEPLFIGRVRIEGSMTVGKVEPSSGVCYIPYGGKEIQFKNYEALVVY